MKYDKAFLTGCDYKYEWLLPWFFKNYKKYNNTPLIFADFGVKNKDIVKDFSSDKIGSIMEKKLKKINNGK